MTSGWSCDMKHVYGHEGWVCAGNLTQCPNHPSSV
eukprot:CAMPEP_0179432030 /NCGR_PEP_ID=MMETSP0799-20121207/16769_1 /TAXON_ID=46947 /ORGANISM="Geminigera cryophila, Strain CCMP2564" /LENGTH=34 /DNA_ID= /DNA_START= /DNA_END= /DNA_ORIENTATION=